MRNNYDFDGVTNLSSSLSGELPRSGHSELPRVSGLQRDRLADREYVTTVLVEPNTLLREGLRRILAESPYNLVASTASLSEARESWGAGQEPFLLIIDASLQQEEIWEQIRQLKEEHPAARVAVLVDAYEMAHVLSVYQAGADAYLLKSISCDVLVKTLDLVMLGEMVFPAAILDLLKGGAHNGDEGQQGESAGPNSDGDERLPPKGLSVRETVILRCLMEGDSNKLIARKFDITEATVKVHVKAILRKIRAKNRTQAAIWAASHLPASSHSPAD